MGLAVDSWVHRRSDGEKRATDRLDRLDLALGSVEDRVRDTEERRRRLERVEGLIARIEAKASEDGGKWQHFIGDITVRLTILEEWRRNGNGYSRGEHL